MYLQGQMSTSIVRNPFWLVSYNQTTQINYLLIYNRLLFTVCPKKMSWTKEFVYLKYVRVRHVPIKKIIKPILVFLPDSLYTSKIM